MAKDDGKLSPMMLQYLSIKDEYRDCILFFRLGDFYEMFFNDAEIASRELDLVLTSRDCGRGEKAPMCGVPFHSADNYIARLVSKGYRIAICEQMEDPALVKGLVERDVVRVITPGTVIESNMLDDATNNYLCSVCTKDGEIGLCFADVSTSEFHITVLSGDDIENKLINQLSTYSPKELIINSQSLDLPVLEKFAKRIDAKVEVLDDCNFEYENASSVIIDTMKQDEFSSIEAQSGKTGACALGAVISYLKDVQKKEEIEVAYEIDCYDDNQYMNLDINTRRNLELTKSMITGDKKHSLLWIIDKTKTAMGKRMIKAWLERPLLSVAKIVKRQNAVSELVDNPAVRDALREAMTGISDMERLITRIVYSTANAKELKSLENTIGKLPEIKRCLTGASSSLLRELCSSIDLLDDVYTLISEAIVDEPPFSMREGGMINQGYSEELDEIRAIMTDGAGVIASIENEQRELTKIPKLKIGYNRVFGYYIEVSNSYKDLVPQTYIRKQTLANCERYITQELKELEGKIIGAKEKSVALEYDIFCNVRKRVADEMQRMQQTAKCIAVLDVIASLAQVAVSNSYVCPVISNDGIIDIKDGRHPVVEALLDGAPFVPNDTLLDLDDNRCAIITGPNMAGKSTYMRQIALITLMGQIGSFVPASSAKIGIVDAIFTRVGASDDLATGQSTFMVEMNEVSNILKNATSASLIILDEIGRGTSTFDGMSIARSVLEFVSKKNKLGAKSLFATHYHELTAMEGLIDGVKNYSVAVKKRGDDISFLRRIVRGGADRSFGIEVAKLAGVPDSVVKRAKVILKELEKNSVKIEFTAENGVVEEDDTDDVQYNFALNGKSEILDILKTIDVNTLTPIEAMQTLYDLKKKAQESE